MFRKKIATKHRRNDLSRFPENESALMFNQSVEL